jgi:hypothetical protein
MRRTSTCARHERMFLRHHTEQVSKNINPLTLLRVSALTPATRALYKATPSGRFLSFHPTNFFLLGKPKNSCRSIHVSPLPQKRLPSNKCARRDQKSLIQVYNAEPFSKIGTTISSVYLWALGSPSI